MGRNVVRFKIYAASYKIVTTLYTFYVIIALNNDTCFSVATPNIWNYVPVLPIYISRPYGQGLQTHKSTSGFDIVLYPHHDKLLARILQTKYAAATRSMYDRSDIMRTSEASMLHMYLNCSCVSFHCILNGNLFKC